MAFRRVHYRIGCLIALAGVAASMMLVAWWLGPPEDLTDWLEGAPPRDWATLKRQEDLWRSEGSSRRVRFEYAPLDQIHLDLQLAVLVGEDISFLDHGAIDLRAVLEALQEWRRGERLRGASTISQQLAKCLFLSQERSLWRKLQEARIAWWLERRLGKRRILELYLNVVEFGPGILGAEAASRAYFGCPAAYLESGEAAALAAAIPSPGRDNPGTATARWNRRRKTILLRMGNASWLRERLRRLRSRPDAADLKLAHPARSPMATFSLRALYTRREEVRPLPTAAVQTRVASRGGLTDPTVPRPLGGYASAFGRGREGGCGGAQ